MQDELLRPKSQQRLEMLLNLMRSLRLVKHLLYGPFLPEARIRNSIYRVLPSAAIDMPEAGVRSLPC